MKKRLTSETKEAPRPSGFDVTDDELDAPDGAIVDGFERRGDRWMPLEPRFLDCNEPPRPLSARERFEELRLAFARVRGHHAIVEVGPPDAPQLELDVDALGEDLAITLGALARDAGKRVRFRMRSPRSSS